MSDKNAMSESGFSSKQPARKPKQHLIQPMRNLMAKNNNSQWEGVDRQPFSIPYHSSSFEDIFPDTERGGGDIIQEIEGQAPVHWSVPWSDLMMVMFVFFAILFYCKKAESEPQEKVAPEYRAAIMQLHEEPFLSEPDFNFVSPRKIYQSSKTVVKEADLDNVEVVLQDDESVKVSVLGPMLFDLGKAELRPETRNFLNAMAEVIKQNSYEIQVVGHTDDYPVSTELFPSNWELSAVRATKVARYLIEYGNLEPGRFTVIGHSKYRPRRPNTSNNNKSLNRRVEIIITRNEFTG
jgi:chemotaxis protein MotB